MCINVKNKRLKIIIYCFIALSKYICLKERVSERDIQRDRGLLRMTLFWSNAYTEPFKNFSVLRTVQPNLSYMPQNMQTSLPFSNNCFSAITFSTPAYISTLLQLYIPHITLRSSCDTRLLKHPHFERKIKDNRSFSYAGLSAWNSLPYHIHHETSPTALKSALKTRTHAYAWVGLVRLQPDFRIQIKWLVVLFVCVCVSAHSKNTISMHSEVTTESCIFPWSWKWVTRVFCYVFSFVLQLSGGLIMTPEDVMISYLPMAHSYERLLQVSYLALTCTGYMTVPCKLHGCTL